MGRVTVGEVLSWKLLLEVAITCGTLSSMWLMGNKSLAGPAIGLANQALWVVFLLVTAAWGLAPLTIAITIIHARNLRKWAREKGEAGK
jgi:hypothetical protein